MSADLPTYHKNLLALDESKCSIGILNNRWTAVMGDVTDLTLSEAYDIFMKRYTKGQKRNKAENDLLKLWRSRYEEIAKKTPCWDDKDDVNPYYIRYIPSFSEAQS